MPKPQRPTKEHRSLSPFAKSLDSEPVTTGARDLPPTGTVSLLAFENWIVLDDCCDELVGIAGSKEEYRLVKDFWNDLARDSKITIFGRRQNEAGTVEKDHTAIPCGYFARPTTSWDGELSPDFENDDRMLTAIFSKSESRERRDTYEDLRISRADALKVKDAYDQKHAAGVTNEPKGAPTSTRSMARGRKPYKPLIEKYPAKIWPCGVPRRNREDSAHRVLETMKEAGVKPLPTLGIVMKILPALRPEPEGE